VRSEKGEERKKEEGRRRWEVVGREKGGSEK
jgi:hypothetical protein